MLLRYSKWKINFFFWTLVIVLTSSAICAILFVVLPHLPKSDGRLSLIDNNPTETSVVAFVLGLLGVVSFVIIISCACSWWIRNKGEDKKDDNDCHLDTQSQLTYKTEKPAVDKRLSRSKQSAEENGKRKSVFEPYQNYGYEDDDSVDSVGQKGGVYPVKASNLQTTPRSSFAEDLYNSFKLIQLNSKLGLDSSPKSQTAGRSFLESVDEEGYHFDNIEFSEESEEEVEIEINSDSRPSFRRLDTFDLKILGAADDLKNQIELDSQAKVKEEEEEVFKAPLTRTVTQESFKGIAHLRAFNKYLSLVHVDSVPSFLERESKDFIETGFNDNEKSIALPIGPENSQALPIGPAQSGNKDNQSEVLSKKKRSDKSSSESSVSSSLEDRSNSSEMEWDATSTNLVMNDKVY